MTAIDTKNYQKLLVPGKWLVEFDADGNFSKILYDTSYREVLGYKADEPFLHTEEAWENSIHPDDRARVLAHLDETLRKHPEGMDFDIEYRMMTKAGYRWFHDSAQCVRRPDGTPERCIGAVFDIQSTMDRYASQERYEKDSKRRSELIQKMSSAGAMFLINCAEDTRKTLHYHLQGGPYSDEEKYSDSLNRYINTFVAPADRQMMREVTSAKYMIERLKSEKEFTIEYRDTASGIQRFYEMRVSRFSGDEVLQSFFEKDKEIIDRLIFNKLEEDYFALYGVDLDSGLIQVLKDSPWYPEGTVGTVKEYTPIIKRFASSFEGDVKAFFEQISDIEYLKKRFAKDNKATFTYKSPFVEGEKWVAVTELVLARHNDGVPSLFALGFSILDEDASEKEELQFKLQEQMGIIGGIASEYNGLYHVDLATGRYKDYIVSERILDTKGKLCRFNRFIELFNEVVDSDAVHPEHRDLLHQFYPSDDALRVALKDKKKISMLFQRNYGNGYLWTEMNVVKCEDVHEEARSVVVGFVEKNEAVRREQMALEAQKLVDNATSTYNIVYLVNMVTDSVRVLRMDENMLEKDAVVKSFSDVRSFFLNQVVHPRDKARMQREMDYGTIREKLQDTTSYQVEYSVWKDGGSVGGEMQVTAIDENEIAIGMSEADKRLLLDHLQQKRYEDYFALFVVDIDTETVKVVKASPWFVTGTEGRSAPYVENMLHFADSLDEEPSAFFRKLADLDYVKNELATENKRTFSYKSKNVDGGKWVNLTSYVTIRHEDGTPAEFTLGFSLADSFDTSNKEVQERLKEDMQMIKGLASEYHALYYFNIEADFFKVYSIDEKRFPEAKLFVSEEGDPLQTFQKFGSSALVHPDDRHLFADLSIQSVREKLAHSKNFAIRFRRKFGAEYLWTEMEFIKYEDVDVPANAIALGFAERDAEIRSEQALKSCFAVLGEDISPQASIDKLMAIAGEYYGAKRAYIFEYTEGNKSFRNTYEWCSIGTEAMISLLQDVPKKELEGWMNEFNRRGAFHMDTLDNANTTPEGREILAMQGIQSLIAAPITNGEEIVGFIGVDDPTKAKDNTAILKTIAVVAFSEILERKENDVEHVTLEKLAETFISVFYVDLTTDFLHSWKISPAYKENFGNAEHYSETISKYIRNCIAVRDRERCAQMASPQSVLEQFKTKDRFSIEVTDLLLGYERTFIYDYVKVNSDGHKFVMCCRDVTESMAREKAQQKKLQEAYDAASKANRSKTDFLFNMSHDIRTPMNAITGFTAMAKRDVDNSGKVSDYLNKIDLAGQQLLLLINQVLEMSRIESGKIELEEKPVNVVENYNSLVTILGEQAKVNGLDFHHSISGIKHRNIFADDARMSQITLNITGNAIKYTPCGGRIDFDFKENPCSREGYASYTFSVSDTGIGMSEEFQKILFEPFSREKNSTVSKIQGTGLGMSIVKSLVDLLGGTIEVHSEQGKGTRFDVTVEFRLADENVVANMPAVPDPKLFSGRHVLLVEDNEMNREIARFILEDRGMIVDEAEDGDIAVKKVEEAHYDIILMDIQMPRMNGFKATSLIRSLPGQENVHTPIIAMTANAFDEDRQNAKAAGMDDHLAKPIDVQQLWSTLAKYL